MSDYAYPILLLLLLAVLSTMYMSAELTAGWSAPEIVDGILTEAWLRSSERYAIEAYELVAARLKHFREQNRGYGDIGIYIEELGSGFSFGYDAERLALDSQGEYVGYYHTASVSKLLLAYAFYHLDDLGETSKQGFYYDTVMGQTFSLQKLSHEMITRSVNLYHNIVLRHLSADNVKEALINLGLPHSRVYREIGWAPGWSNETCLARHGSLDAPRTTPRDLGRLLADVYHGTTLSAENRDVFMHSLTTTIFNTRIPLGIGYAVPVAHKTGTKDWVYNDAGIVLLPENPFVLVILTRGVPGRVETFMRQLSRDVYLWERSRLESGEALRMAELRRFLQQGW